MLLSNPMLRRALLVLLPPVVLFAAFEFAIDTLDLAPPPRSPIVVWNPERDAELREARGAFRFHPRWLWEPRPGAVLFGDAVNEDGYRGPRYPVEKGQRLRIATLGDSTTFGYGLPESASWSRVLESVLRAYGQDVEVLNFGVVGYTIEQGYRLYEGRVADYRPDVVVAAFGAINDQFPELLTDREKVERLSRFDLRLRLFLERYESVRWLESRFGVGGDPLERPDGRRYVERVPPEEFSGRLRDLEAAVRRDGGALVLVCPPRRANVEPEYPKTVEYTRRIHEAASTLSLPLAEVHDTLRAIDRAELGPRLRRLDVARRSRLFLDNFHPSAAGHRAFALVVGKTLLDAGLLPDLVGKTLPDLPVPAGASSGGTAESAGGGEGAAGG